MTNECLLELFPVGFRGIEKVGTEVTQVTEGSLEGTLSSSDGRSDLGGERYNTIRYDIVEWVFSPKYSCVLTGEDVANGTGSTEATESTENSGQTLVEEVLTEASEGTLDFTEKSAQD